MKPIVIVLQKTKDKGNSLCPCAQVYLGFQIHIKEAEFFNVLKCSFCSNEHNA